MKNHIQKGSILGNVVISLSLIAVVASHFIMNVMKIGGTGFTYYVGYVIWIIMGIYILFIKKCFIIQRTWVNISILFLCTEIVGILLGEANSFNVVTDIHRAFFYIIALFILLGVKKFIVLTDFQTEAVMKIIIWLGIIASAYAMLNQRDNMVQMLQGVNKSINSWKYVSFFRQRNIYAAFCYFCSIPTAYFFIKSKNIIYGGILLVFLFQILITDSRAAQLSVLLLFSLLIYFRKRNNKILIIVALLICFFF